MFAKLLKHEWRATRGIIALLCVIILISGLTIGGVTYYMVKSEAKQANNVSVDGLSIVLEAEEDAMPELTMVLCILLITAGVIAIVVCCAGSVFFLIYRFYKRCFTDEGYLTFTLPVNNHQILLSSLVNCILGQLLVIAAAILAIAIVFGMFLLLINSIETIVWADVWTSWDVIWQQLWSSFVKNIDQFALVGFSAVFGALSELVVLMLAVTIGAMIAKKHKILAAFGVYYGINMASSFLMQLAAGLGVVFVVVPVTDLLVMGDFSVNTICLVISLMLLILLLMEAAVACLFHFLALGKLERKLNLS